MRFSETGIHGAYLDPLDPVADERGNFARLFCRETFERHDMGFSVNQVSLSATTRAGTIRGMHYQAAPHQEEKLVYCVKGGVFDVLIDLRPESPTFRTWKDFQLTEDALVALYVPAGIAHGFQSLVDDVNMLYQISAPYRPSHARGVRWDDPSFQVEWPLPVIAISEQDRSFSDFSWAE